MIRHRRLCSLELGFRRSVLLDLPEILMIVIKEIREIEIEIERIGTDGSAGRRISNLTFENPSGDVIACEH